MDLQAQLHFGEYFFRVNQLNESELSWHVYHDLGLFEDQYLECYIPIQPLHQKLFKSPNNRIDVSGFNGWVEFRDTSSNYTYVNCENEVLQTDTSGGEYNVRLLDRPTYKSDFSNSFAVKYEGFNHQI